MKSEREFRSKVKADLSSLRLKSVRKLKRLRYFVAAGSLARMKTRSSSKKILESIVDIDEELLRRGKSVVPMLKRFKLNAGRTYQIYEGLTRRTIDVFSSIVPESLYLRFRERKFRSFEERRNPYKNSPDAALPDSWHRREFLYRNW
jgi:hypothetical protein